MTTLDDFLTVVLIVLLISYGFWVLPWLTERVSLRRKRNRKPLPIKQWVRKEISYKDLGEMDAYQLVLPKVILREWGFDPHREIVFWNDDARECRVYQQEVR